MTQDIWTLSEAAEGSLGPPHKDKTKTKNCPTEAHFDLNYCCKTPAWNKAARACLSHQNSDVRCSLLHNLTDKISQFRNAQARHHPADTLESNPERGTMDVVGRRNVHLDNNENETKMPQRWSTQRNVLQKKQPIAPSTNELVKTWIGLII